MPNTRLGHEVPPVPDSTSAVEPTRRASSRVRVKSSRAIESEQTNQLLAAKREQVRLGRDTNLGSTPEMNLTSDVDMEKKDAEIDTGLDPNADRDDVSNGEKVGSVKQSKSRSRAVAPKKKSTAKPKPKVNSKATIRGKRKGDEYCVCREQRDGPMIECGICSDWFHFECIGLTVREAERIGKYVCDDCEAQTGEKSTRIFDIVSLHSPTPPPDVDTEAASSDNESHTALKKANEVATDLQPDASSSSGSSSVAAPSEPASDSESDFGSSVAASAVVADKRKAKRVRITSPSPAPEPKSKRASLSGVAALAAKKGLSTTVAEALPPARQYVLDKMASVVRGLFGEDRMDVQAAEAYARSVETTIFNHFKEVIKGKDMAGVRYKAQFNLLSSSLAKDIRPDLRQSIIDGTLSATQVALLTAADLASSELLAEIEKAKQASLQQTVKAKEDVGGVRIGRDGFERVEDVREKELVQLAKLEEAQRRRDSGGAQFKGVIGGGDDSDRESDTEKRQRDSARDLVGDASDSSVAQAPTFTHVSRLGESMSHGESGAGGAGSSPLLRRKSSTAAGPSPTASTFRLSSAWGGVAARSALSGADVGGVELNELELGLGDEQGEIDLSDIIAPEGEIEGLGSDDMEMDVEVGEETKAPTPALDPAAEFLEKPVVWSGGMINPAQSSTHTPPIQLRLISGRASNPPPLSYWSFLLPNPVISITGRVPTAQSLQYLSDRRFDRNRELTTVAFSLDPKATEEERKAWSDMIEFHVGRDRHGLYHPYGEKPPAGAARELYLIPLRPTDKSPDLMDLMDNYSLPKSGRTEAVLVGVFVSNRDAPPPAVPSTSAPIQAAPPAQRAGTVTQSPPPPPIIGQGPLGPPPPVTPSISIPDMAPPVLPNLQLQALMASLNPTAIQSVLSSQPPIMSNQPRPPFPPTLPGHMIPPNPPPQSHAVVPPPTRAFYPPPTGYRPDLYQPPQPPPGARPEYGHSPPRSWSGRGGGHDNERDARDGRDRERELGRERSRSRSPPRWGGRDSGGRGRGGRGVGGGRGMDVGERGKRGRDGGWGSRGGHGGR